MRIPPTEAMKPGYQKNKYEAALEYVKKWDVAVDVGAHCGTWAIRMQDDFERVICFEPIREMAQLCEENCPQAEVVNVGLSDTRATVIAKYDKDHPSWTKIVNKIPEDSEYVDFSVMPLDDFSLPELDFLKIDVEGHEAHVVRGARHTILRCKPVIVVEQKSNKTALKLLKEWGFKEVGMMNRDYIMVP
jgi:FkbM family methyltransferase